VWRCVLYFGQYEIVKMMLSLTKLDALIFACYVYTNLLIGSTCVLPSSRGSAGAYGFWMHSLDGGRATFIHGGGQHSNMIQDAHGDFLLFISMSDFMLPLWVTHELVKLKLWNLRLCNKRLCASLWCRGRGYPLLETSLTRGVLFKTLCICTFALPLNSSTTLLAFL
jgi:hypothetical protein